MHCAELSWRSCFLHSHEMYDMVTAVYGHFFLAFGAHFFAADRGEWDKSDRTLMFYLGFLLGMQINP